jgi:putative oxidoreductase
MMGRLITGRPANLILRLLLGCMFVFASFGKIYHPHQFAISVRAYEIVPVSISNLFAIATSWSEMVTGVLLILGLLTRKAAGSACLLLLMFTAAIATVTVRGMVIDCGCFGSDGATTGPLLLGRNLILLAAAFIVLRFNDGTWGLDAAFKRRVPQTAP